MMKKKWIANLCLGTAAVIVAGVFSVSATSEDKSAAIYKQKCAACHGADGKADTPTGKSMNVRSFSDPYVVKMSDDELAEVIDKGKGKMPGYGKSLKPEEIKGLVAYVRTLAR